MNTALRILACLCAGALALAGARAPAADIDDMEADDTGRLFQAKANGRELIACVDGDEGRFYAVLPPDAQGVFFTPQTRLMARLDAGDARSRDALSGTWQTVLEGSSGDMFVSRPQSRDNPEYDWMELQADGAGRWQGTLHYFHYQKDDYTAKKIWETASIAFTPAAENCRGFEDWRLNLPWQPVTETAKGEGGYASNHKVDYRPVAVALRRFRHPATQVAYVELLPNRFVAAAQAERINVKLRQLAMRMNGDWRHCKDYDGNVSLVADSPRIAVFQGYSWSYCGGAHGNDDPSLYSFDLQTGNAIEPETWFVRTGRELMVAGQPVGFDLPDGLVQPLMRVVRSKLAGDAERAECVGHIRETSDDFVPWFSAQGVQFRRIEDALPLVKCRGDYALAFKTVRPFIKPDKLKDFDAIAKSFAARNSP